jgi:hypothetical protein
MTAEEKETSERVMRRRLFWGGIVTDLDAPLSAIRDALIARGVDGSDVVKLHSFVGSDGLWAARAALEGDK